MTGTPIDPGEKTARLARALATIRERWWAVLVTAVIVGGLALGISLLFEPRYKASAQMAYLARDAEMASQALTSSGTAALVHNISSDALIIRTSGFAGRVSQVLSSDLSPEDLRSATEVTYDPVGDVIAVTAVSTEPLEAAEIADAYANQFVAERQIKIEESLTEARTLLEARTASLTEEEASSTRGFDLRQQLDDLQVFLAMELNEYVLLQRAIVPTSAYFPRPFLNLLIGVCTGLLLGIVVALLLGYFDHRIKDRSTLERVMGLPVLGTMPPNARKGRTGSPGSRPAAGFGEDDEALLESMRMLRSGLKVLGFGDSKRSVLLTSATPEPGKSRLAVNLALTMALAGDRVVLVDADMRDPKIDRYLGIPNREGLADVLLDGGTSWSARLQVVDLSPYVTPRTSLSRRPADKAEPPAKFLCLTSGPAPGNPTEMVESDAMAALLSNLQGISDYVILDGPPLLVASDALILAQDTDAVILASTLGEGTVSEALQVKQLLARAGITALGAVICGGSVPAVGAYYHVPARTLGHAARGA